jgi:hypothetical protein
LIRPKAFIPPKNKFANEKPTFIGFHFRRPALPPTFVPSIKKIGTVMKKLLYILFLHIIPNTNSVAQTVIKGKITDRKGESLPFSAGGYSAQYGQVLSSVLLLDTPDKTNDASSTNLLAHLAGVGVSHTLSILITTTRPASTE